MLVRIELALLELRPSQLEAATRRFGPELRASASESRSQWRNRSLALERAMAQLDAAIARERPRVATRATKASKERRLAAKSRRARTKRDRRAPPED